MLAPAAPSAALLSAALRCRAAVPALADARGGGGAARGGVWPHHRARNPAGRARAPGHIPGKKGIRSGGGAPWLPALAGWPALACAPLFKPRPSLLSRPPSLLLHMAADRRRAAGTVARPCSGCAHHPSAPGRTPAVQAARRGAPRGGQGAGRAGLPVHHPAQGSAQGPGPLLLPGT